ncbi:hypothetical protein ABE85_02175 [Mitsuaria sp. 7]|nr:hypothetical protein ABE85_02175 [Mitsuaria sp. 7]
MLRWVAISVVLGLGMLVRSLRAFDLEIQQVGHVFVLGRIAICVSHRRRLCGGAFSIRWRRIESRRRGWRGSGQKGVNRWGRTGGCRGARVRTPRLGAGLHSDPANGKSPDGSALLGRLHDLRLGSVARCPARVESTCGLYPFFAQVFGTSTGNILSTAGIGLILRLLPHFF